MRGWSVLAFLALAGCVPAAGQVEPARRASPRIMSLNPCTDALLAQVADRDQIVALSDYSRQPGVSSMDVALARSFPGTDGSLEEVIVAAPGLVVTGAFTPPATRAAMARLGLPLREFGMASTVEESEAQIRDMAQIAGHRERGEALIAQIEAALRAAAPPPGQAVPALVWQGGGLVAGPQTLISDLLRRTGFAPLSATRGMGQAQFLPLEEVVADPPRVILAVGHGAEDGEGGREGNRSLSHPVLASLKGTSRFRLDPTLEYCGGPTIIRAAQRLAQIRREVGA